MDTSFSEDVILSINEICDCNDEKLKINELFPNVINADAEFSHCYVAS